MNMLNLDLARELHRDRERMITEAHRAQRVQRRPAASRAPRVRIRIGLAVAGRLFRAARRWLSPAS